MSSKKLRRAREQALEDAFRAYHNAVDRVDEAVADYAGLNRTDLRCLDILERRGPLSAGALARASGLTTGAVTTLLDRLEHAGYARRSRDLEDRRRVLVDLTDGARKAATDLYGPLARAHAAAVAELTDDDLDRIRAFVEDSTEINERHADWLREQAASLLSAAVPPAPPASGA